MIKNKDIISSLPILASALSDKYGVKVQVSGSKAYTDGSTINIPSLPIKADDNFISLVRGYLDHEAAHIKETDFNALKIAKLSPLEMFVWNSLEDWRVENKLSAIYPGCKINFNWLIRHLFLDSKEEREEKSVALNILDWFLLKIRSWNLKELEVQTEELEKNISKVYPSLLEDLKLLLVNAPAACTSTQTTIAFAKKIIVCIKKYAALTEREQTKSLNTKKLSGENKVGSEKLLATRKSKDAKNLRKLLRSKANELPKSMGEQIATKITTSSAKSGERLTVAIESKKEAFELSSKEIRESLRASNALKSRLLGVLQSTSQRRSQSAYSGKIDTKNLHKIYLSDPKLFLRQEQRQSLNTAVHILLDCSRSMFGKHMDLASKASFAISHALKPINGISLAVTAFPGEPILTKDNNGINGSTVFPLIKRHERMHSKFKIKAAGTTPLGEALWWTIQKLERSKNKRKIILILSDGEPDSIDNFKLAKDKAQILGIELYGIGILHSLELLLPTSSVSISNVEELAPAVFNILQNALLINY